MKLIGLLISIAVVTNVLAADLESDEAVVVPANAGAADKKSSSPSETISALPEVTVTGHYDNAVGTSDAASQGVVRGKLLRDIPLLRPGEVLETVPGMVSSIPATARPISISCADITWTMAPTSPPMWIVFRRTCPPMPMVRAIPM